MERNYCGRDLLAKHMGWAIGNGESIRIWQEVWLSSSSQVKPMGPATYHSLHATVSDLFLPNTREWDREKIWLLLPHAETPILHIKPSLSGAPYKRIWLKTLTGDYTTKTGYNAALDDRKSETLSPDNREVN